MNRFPGETAVDTCRTNATPTERKSSRCCPTNAPTPPALDDLPWIVGWLDTPVGRVPQVATKLSARDRRSAVRVRLDFRRGDYAVPPGLYAVGRPTPDSPVLVSANYKLSFDCLRRELEGLAAWILVLDTKGINVWCAAGKGVFGTAEMINRIELTALTKVVAHRTLITPQLGAPGVAAHEVKQRSGFRVVYGPVRAKDTRAFLEAGMQATPEMRQVRFGLRDRLAVIPVEFVQALKYGVFAAACLFILSGLSRDGYDSVRAVAHGSRAALLLCLSVLGGCALTPILLPWLHGRAFSTKGATIGIMLAFCVLLLYWPSWSGTGGRLETVAWFLMMPAVSAFLAMNFTGASTYTSLSGVEREMRIAVPAQIIAAVIGLALWMAARFF